MGLSENLKPIQIGYVLVVDIYNVPGFHLKWAIVDFTEIYSDLQIYSLIPVPAMKYHPW